MDDSSPRLRSARGALNDRPAKCNTHATLIEEYVFVTAPVPALFYPISSARQWIRRREPFGELRANLGKERHVVLAPAMESYCGTRACSSPKRSADRCYSSGPPLPQSMSARLAERCLQSERYTTTCTQALTGWGRSRPGPGGLGLGRRAQTGSWTHLQRTGHSQGHIRFP